MRPDGRNSKRSRVSSVAAGMRWASTITTIGLEMALPPLLGAWLDQRFGTSPVWVLVLSLLGFVAAMTHIWQLTRRLSGERRPADSRSSASQDEKGTS